MHRRSPKKLPKGWWTARFVKAMKVAEGKRYWLIAWAGAKDDSTGWEDSWEPTANVSQDLRDAYLTNRIDRARRAIEVDVRPLDELVKQAIKCAIKGVGEKKGGEGTIASFGHVYKTPVAALTLCELADDYLTTVAEQFNLEKVTQYNPEFKQEISEVRIEDQDKLGDYLAFEKIFGEKGGIKNIRYVKRGDLIVVGALYLRYYDNKAVKGAVTFEAESQVCKINSEKGMEEEQPAPQPSQPRCESAPDLKSKKQE